MMLHIEKQLTKRRHLGNLRQLQVAPPLIDFSSNDSLGLARSPLLAAAMLEEWKNHTDQRMGSTGSRLLTGNSLYAQSLEEKIATFHGYEAGVLFSCGYMANVGLISTVAGEDTTLFFDAAVHASTRDGIRLSRASAFPFWHNDLTHLEQRLKECTRQGDRFICVESIYSTDGSVAPLREIATLAESHNAHLIVDEAHAVGVYGPQGRGLVAHHHLTGRVFAQVVTFGKALGTYGAIVLGSDLLKQALLNFATSYIYTTALPFPMLAAIACSYDLFPHLEHERAHLHTLIQEFCAAQATHIQCVPLPGNQRVKEASHSLARLGFDVRPLMSPTVRRGEEMLRICLHAFNTVGEVRALLEGLHDA